MNEAQRLAKAKADYEAALAEVRRLKAEAEAAISTAETAQGKAYAEMEAAQVAADRLLPTCDLHSYGRFSGKRARELRCVIKRTAKTASVKIIGLPDDRAQQFRIDKDGRWNPFPKQDPQGRITHWIEFPDETSAPDPV